MTFAHHVNIPAVTTPVHLLPQPHTPRRLSPPQYGSWINITGARPNRKLLASVVQHVHSCLPEVTTYSIPATPSHAAGDLMHALPQPCIRSLYIYTYMRTPCPGMAGHGDEEDPSVVQLAVNNRLLYTPAPVPVADVYPVVTY